MCVQQQIQVLANAQIDQVKRNMAFKHFGSFLSNSRKDSPLKVAHSRYKLEINLVLTSVYKVNYPKQRSHIMSKTNLRLVFSSNFNLIRVRSLTQELIKACDCERLSVLSCLTFQPCKAYVIRQSEAQGNGFSHPLQGSDSS